MHRYLTPTYQKEKKELKKEMEKMDDKEAKKMIELTTSWEEKGRIEGQAEMLLKQLKKRFGEIPEDMEIRIKKLTEDKLEQLAEAIFDLESIDDVRDFLK